MHHISASLSNHISITAGHQNIHENDLNQPTQYQFIQLSECFMFCECVTMQFCSLVPKPIFASILRVCAKSFGLCSGVFGAALQITGN